MFPLLWAESLASSECWRSWAWARKAPQFLTKYISHYTQIIARTRDRLFPCIQTDPCPPGHGGCTGSSLRAKCPGPGVLCRYLTYPLSIRRHSDPGKDCVRGLKTAVCPVSTQTTLQQRPVAAATACYDEITAEVVKLSHCPSLARPTPPSWSPV